MKCLGYNLIGVARNKSSWIHVRWKQWKRKKVLQKVMI